MSKYHPGSGHDDLSALLAIGESLLEWPEESLNAVLGSEAYRATVESNVEGPGGGEGDEKPAGPTAVFNIFVAPSIGNNPFGGKHAVSGVAERNLHLPDANLNNLPKTAEHDHGERALCCHWLCRYRTRCVRVRGGITHGPYVEDQLWLLVRIIQGATENYPHGPRMICKRTLYMLGGG